MIDIQAAQRRIDRAERKRRRRMQFHTGRIKAAVTARDRFAFTRDYFVSVVEHFVPPGQRDAVYRKAAAHLIEEANRYASRKEK